MPGNEVRLCQLLGLLIKAILDEPGKPNRPSGGLKMGLFSIFFYSALKGKFHHAPEWSQILSVTCYVSLGYFRWAWVAQQAIWGPNMGQIKKMSFSTWIWNRKNMACLVASHTCAWPFYRCTGCIQVMCIRSDCEANVSRVELHMLRFISQGRLCVAWLFGFWV